MCFDAKLFCFFSCPFFLLPLSTVIFLLYCLPLDWPSTASSQCPPLCATLEISSEVGAPAHPRLSKSLPTQAYPVTYIIKSLILCLAFQNLPNLAPVCFFIWISPHFSPSILCIAPFLAIVQSLNIPLLFCFHAFVQTTPYMLWPSPCWSASCSFQIFSFQTFLSFPFLSKPLWDFLIDLLS